MEFSSRSQIAVRVNPHHLIGSSDEESEVISTVSRPASHALFSSKRIHFFGPIGIGAGGIPLRELRVGVGNRTGPGIQQDIDLPNPSSTIFYCHYTGHPLTAKQFEVLWQFNKFIKEENVVGIDDKRKEGIMTLWNKVPRPRTTFDKRARKYRYENWTDGHFDLFFEEYCASKAAMAMVDPMKRATASEWMGLRPPRPLTTDEWLAFVAEIGCPWLIESDEDCPKVDKRLEELVAAKQLQEEKCIPNGGQGDVSVESRVAQNHTKGFHNVQGQQKSLSSKIKSDPSKHFRVTKRQNLKRRFPEDRQAGKGSGKRQGHAARTISPASSHGNMNAAEAHEASDDSIDILL